MTFIERLEMIERVHLLVCRKATGTPEDLARKLNISKRAVFDLIQLMKDMEAPLEYSKENRTYKYTKECFFYIGYNEKMLYKGGNFSNYSAIKIVTY